MSHVRISGFFSTLLTLVLAVLIVFPASLAVAQEPVETASSPEPPTFLENVNTEEDWDALTEVQQAEVRAYISEMPLPGPVAGGGVDPLMLDNIVNCFDYYTFGSVQVSLSATVGTAVNGTKLTFTGELLNENPYPVVDGSVYVKIFKLPADGTTPTNGYDVVDQFFVADKLSLQASGTLPLTFTWDVPTHITSGNYQAAFFFTSARRFNLMGLPFTDDVVGNVTEFTIFGEREDTVAFDKDSVMVDNNDYFFAAFTPKVSDTDPINVTATLENTTATTQEVPVTWTTYAWDQQQEENIITESTELVTLDAKQGQELTYTVTDTTSSVYLVVARAQYEDTSSVLNVRFTRTGIPTTRINYPAVTSYPLTAGEPAEVFSCVHGAGTLDLIEDNTLTLTLADQEGNQIHSYTYEGPVTGAMMGVADTFIPQKSYTDFTLTATLFHEDTIVDTVTMHYDCEVIGGTECVVAGASLANNKDTDRTTSLLLQLGGILLLIVLILIALLRLRKDKKDAPADTDSDSIQDITTLHKRDNGTEGKITPTLLLIVSAFSFTMLVGMPGEAVAAKSVVWSSGPLTGLGFYQDLLPVYHGDVIPLQPSCEFCIKQYGLRPGTHATIVSHVRLINDVTGEVISDDAVVQQGTRIRVEHEKRNTDIAYFGTGYDLDTPYGQWVQGAGPVTDACLAGYSMGAGDFYNPLMASVYTYGLYTILNVHPPTLTVSGQTDNLSCGTRFGYQVCEVESGGPISLQVNVSDRYGYFYARYVMGGICYGNNYRMTEILPGSGFGDKTGTPFELNVPDQSLTFNLSSPVVSNNPPEPPLVSGTDGTVAGTEERFRFNAADPDDDPVRFAIDWNMDGNIDQWTSDTHRHTSGRAAKTWLSSGTTTFRALTEDNHGSRSGWTEHTLMVCSSDTTWDRRSGACIANTPPNPPTIIGVTEGKVGILYDYTVEGLDPDNDEIRYQVQWTTLGRHGRPDTADERTDWLLSGTPYDLAISWASPGEKIISARTEDVKGSRSAWTFHTINICELGSSWDTAQGTCVVDTYTCIGPLPSNVQAHGGDNVSNLSQDTTWLYAEADTSRKCEFTCATNHMWNSSTGECEYVPPTCTGGIPTHGEEHDFRESRFLTVTLPWVHADEDTSRKCEFTCESGYGWDGDSCELATCTGPIPTNASAHGVDETQGLRGNEPWIHSLDDTGLKCEFSCDDGYVWNNTTGLCDTTTVHPEPTLTFTANPTTALIAGDDTNDDVTLSWTVTDATSCTASGDWSGAKNAGGGWQTISDLTSDQTYSLSCTGPGGTTPEETVTVNVLSQPDLTSAGYSVIPSAGFDLATGEYDYLEFAYRIENSGDTNAGNFTNSLTFDGNAAVDAPPPVGSLAAGATTLNVIRRLANNVSFGAHQIILNIDNTDAVSESDETNNTLTVNTTIDTTLPPPDPGIELEITPDLVRSGDTAEVTWDVKTTFFNSCTVLGQGIDETFDPADPIDGTTGSAETAPISFKTEYLLTCTVTDAAGNTHTYSDSAFVETVGTYEEI